jgi:hypothetical protein
MTPELLKYVRTLSKHFGDDDIVSYLVSQGYSVGKTHVKFAIYDTKGSHDSAWIESR